MATETERKFLLKALPPGLDSGEAIHQGYISTGEPEIRLRYRNFEYFLTQKSSGDLTREEQEERISEQVFRILWPLTEGKRLSKTRYRLTSGNGLVWEIDEFHEHLEGLFIAEIELPTEGTFAPFPDSLADLVSLEVTENAEYKNKNLVKKMV